MHGGSIYLRGHVSEDQLGKEVGLFPIEDDDRCLLESLLEEFASDTEISLPDLSIEEFTKLCPYSHRPYGSMYCY